MRSFFATDNAGNVETPKTATVMLDKTPPVTTASAKPPPNPAGWNNQANVTVTLSATNNLAGVARTEFNLDGADWTAYSAPIVVTAEGRHVLKYRPVDKADGVQTAHQLAVNIDRTAPEASIHFDPTSKDIPVFSHDALSGTPPGPVKPSSVTPAQWGKDNDGRRAGFRSDGSALSRPPRPFCCVAARAVPR